MPDPGCGPGGSAARPRGRGAGPVALPRRPHARLGARRPAARAVSSRAKRTGSARCGKWCPTGQTTISACGSRSARNTRGRPDRPDGRGGLTYGVPVLASRLRPSSRRRVTSSSGPSSRSAGSAPDDRLRRVLGRHGGSSRCGPGTRSMCQLCRNPAQTRSKPGTASSGPRGSGRRGRTARGGSAPRCSRRPPPDGVAAYKRGQRPADRVPDDDRGVESRVEHRLVQRLDDGSEPAPAEPAASLRGPGRSKAIARVVVRQGGQGRDCMSRSNVSPCRKTNDGPVASSAPCRRPARPAQRTPRAEQRRAVEFVRGTGMSFLVCFVTSLRYTR